MVAITKLDKLLIEVRACRVCEPDLPLGPNPIVRAKRRARILIIGQAPGTKVHESGIPWNDPSGKRLREWMGIDDEIFYNQAKIAIIPMGLCYPGKGKSGDLPPRKECSELWHEKLLKHLPNIKLTLLIGQYAQNYYLSESKHYNSGTVTETVTNWKKFAPKYFPLPHPSPRNTLWLKKNSWFESKTIPHLRKQVSNVIRD
ncbi:MAG: uracil-DNA glycosylase family protein [Gammaproteobacteria bacterium]|nr:MAG: uracil-DNA glycosylase family protein [Gammaproteobacteria bacterium]